jgi:ribosomal-protein-alanine N-acetyltransferase
VIRTQRFFLRPLTVADVSERYLSWLSDIAAQRFIHAASNDVDLDHLQKYVARCEARDDILFLGVFTHEGEHIGNIKYEPVDSKQSAAVAGILIGEKVWRGKGVAGEVITASAYWLQQYRGIRVIVLGVDRDNLPAIRAYKKLGFVEEQHTLLVTNSTTTRPMVWLL